MKHHIFKDSRQPVLIPEKWADDEVLPEYFWIYHTMFGSVVRGDWFLCSSWCGSSDTPNVNVAVPMDHPTWEITSYARSHLYPCDAHGWITTEYLPPEDIKIVTLDPASEATPGDLIQAYQVLRAGDLVGPVDPFKFWKPLV